MIAEGNKIRKHPVQKIPRIEKINGKCEINACIDITSLIEYFYFV